MTIEQRMIIAKAIREGRKRADMSQEELGEKLGYVKQTISNWELCKSEVPEDEFEKINKALNLNISMKALNDMEERKVRNTKIKPLQDIDRFEDYDSLFEEILDEVFGKSDNDRAYRILVKKFLYIATTQALWEIQKGEWGNPKNYWNLVAFKFLQIINENLYFKKELDDRCEGIVYQLNEVEPFISDSFSNFFNEGKSDNIVFEKEYEIKLAKEASGCISDITMVLPKRENTFVTTLMVYLVETHDFLLSI